MAGQDNHVYGFSRPQSSLILQKLGIGGGEETPLSQRGKSVNCLVRTPVGGIAALSGSVVTFASCDVYLVDGTSLTSSGFTVPVGNVSSVLVPASTYITPVWAGGALIVAYGQPGIINLRLSGSDLQYTFDGTNWTTWTTGTSCP